MFNNDNLFCIVYDNFISSFIYNFKITNLLNQPARMSLISFETKMEYKKFSLRIYYLSLHKNNMKT